MQRQFGNIELDTDLSRVQFDRVHRWLETCYWSPNVAMETVLRAASNSSLVIGAYHNGLQVGYMRVVSDRATFAWVCDVFVDDAFRKQGIAKEMVRLALSDPDHQGLRRWVLATRDAHDIYSECGFVPLPMPERWMARLLPS